MSEKFPIVSGGLPKQFDDMGVRFVAHDAEQMSCTMAFDVGPDYCHSGNVIQGGFVTAMIDVTMACAMYLNLPGLIMLPSLEIKVSFLAPSLAGPVTARAKVIKRGKSVVFFEGELLGPDGVATATATSTASYRLREAD